MDGFLVRRFASEQRTALVGTQVSRAVCVGDGLVLALQHKGAELELGFGAAPGAAWAWCAARQARATLHAEIGAIVPELVRPEPELGWREPSATALDALRAWILRPTARQPGWSHLVGCRVEELAALGTDRILGLDLEKQDAVGRSTRLRLQAQLFDHGANVILTNDAGAELANRTGRPAATARSSEPRAQLEATARLTWDPEKRVHVATGADAKPLSLLTLAFLDLAAANGTQLVAQQRRASRRRESHLAKLLEKLAEESRAAEAAESWRRLGELLSANLHRVRRGQSRLTVEDLFDAGKPRDIVLDPQLSPQENVALFFKRARRGERGLATILARQAATGAALQEVREHLQGLEGERLGWADAVRAAPGVWRSGCAPDVTSTPLPALWAAAGPQWSGAERQSAPEAAEPQGPGRRFVLAGGWEVRVGRSNAENDALTHGFARPDDVWMHASGVAGSHLVLRMQGRGGNPPRDVLETAAAIAAHFSKARHSKTVPVIWTRKRYVRKPRGAKPGLASCTQEKTLFVRPGLPGGGG